MQDGVRISDSPIARAVTESRSLLPRLQDPQGQGQESRRIRTCIQDAIESSKIAVAISLFVAKGKMLTGGGKFMADCLS